ncbi:MAG: hypothetical protein A4S15_03030 [Candidatus Raskinella chloraquaticus]|uniref:Uncharacterized protein n=1 Tax=Candidatus Raskinella chloraquaticus TaxID=1951219 RepID=A0A1W9HQH3_9HYPH|nr:MAG: hypothetical protein A4S15_03030 [Proteobacteria bacterium SG_bin8]
MIYAWQVSSCARWGNFGAMEFAMPIMKAKTIHEKLLKNSIFALLFVSHPFMRHMETNFIFITVTSLINGAFGV